MSEDSASGRLLGSGKEAEIFEYGPAVLKLYKVDRPKRAAFREAGTLAVLESFGLPVPQVQGVLRIGCRWGMIMSRAGEPSLGADGPSFASAARLRPDLLPDYLNAMAALHRSVHAHPGTQFANAKARLAADIGNAGLLGAVQRKALLERLAAMPEGDRLCHGDFHPLNILGPPGRAIIIDWPNVSCGDPAADVCRSYILIRSVAPDIASAYVDAYATRGSFSREHVLAWLPFIAAARLAEGVPDEEDDLLRIAAAEPNQTI
jgi:aminoglycoside phosphotransferase (APT) family kinase protein